MLQRIQSVYFLLAALVLSILFWRNTRIITTESSDLTQEESMHFLDDQILDVYDHNLLLALTAMAIIISVIAIFLFRNRTLQLNLGRGAILIALVFVLFSFYLGYADLKDYLNTIKIQPKLGLSLPFISIILILLALKGVKKDEKLVRSMDRLR